MRFFRTGRLIFSILSVALVALPSAASAAPKPDNRCLRLAHSKHVVKLSESGVVLDYDFADPKSPLYGCLFSTEKVRKLEPTWGTNLALEGRYEGRVRVQR